VNQLTGDYTLSANDASAFDMSVTRTASSRRPDAGTKQEGQAPIFGQEWTAGTVAELTEYGWWGQPAKTVETANGVTRTTTLTTDGAGRLTKTTVTGGVGTAVPETTITYAPDTERFPTSC
jgi:hypothetical protein